MKSKQGFLIKDESKVNKQSVFSADMINELSKFSENKTLAKLNIACKFFHVHSKKEFEKRKLNSWAQNAVICGDSYTIFTSLLGQHYACGINNHGQLCLGDKGKKDKIISLNIKNIKQITPGLLNNTYIVFKDSSVSSSAFNFTNTNIKKIIAGNFHVFFIQTNGDVIGGGYNEYGAVGVKQKSDFIEPTLLDIPGVKNIYIGDSQTFFMMNNNTILVFGNNKRGQLGLKSRDEYNAPTLLPIAETIKKIACGSTHSLMLTDKETVIGCGNNDSGQLGFPGYSDDNDLTVLPITNAANVFAAADHTFVLLTNGAVLASGDNSYGQLGIGENIKEAKELTQLTALKDEVIVNIFTSSSHTIFINDKGKLFGCGFNLYGQLGIPPGKNVYIPLELPIDLINDVILESTEEKKISFTSSGK